ncbi:MAG: hypothetical protein A3J65_02295 [Candidatus Buchananbacteria bacterium RIFCSPHIGHO2_02_FULL_45_11b]|uniref:Glycosyltransferase RgtA/B/C/D-like domain-containing protein n=2 Tax=Candidatus Buchananiibacteriota TaxID=1817903 RepID=A0A1G1YE98_9BACT|nr:MAG: hypothetical protein A3J65_02295 [Candidatus Buchananbacteria bacterium RIFCSPHIGHO2_02_FULL_45_11b]
MKDLINSITPKEWRFVALMSVVMILLTGLPFLYGYLMAPPNTAYNGLHAFSPGDFPVYYSYINQVKDGQYFLKDLFTGEAQSLGTFNVWWFLIGLAVKISGLPIPLVFQLARLAMIPVFLFVFYLFLSYFVPEVKIRKYITVFLLFSGGLGFYFAGFSDRYFPISEQFYSWPIDLWLTESNIFNTLYQTSHFIASVTLTMLIFLLTLLAWEKRKISCAFIAGFLSLFYFNFHPYYLPVIFGVLGAYLFWLILSAKKILWQETFYLLLIFLISLPSAIYHFWLISNEPVIGFRAMQNITYISPWPFVLAGFGFLPPGFILGAYFIWKNKKLNRRLIFLIIWLLVNAALIYSPFPFHSRYTQGLQIVMAIFTVLGFLELKDYLKKKIKPKTFDFWVDNPALIFILFLLFFATAPLYSLSRDFYYFTYKPGRIKATFYLPNDVYRAIGWLDKQKNPGAVLAGGTSTNFIPAFSGQRVYSAHGHETLFFYAKAVWTALIFADNKNDALKRRILKKENIRYVFYSEYEKRFGDFNPAIKDYLKLVFDSPEAKVYEVIE